MFTKVAIISFIVVHSRHWDDPVNNCKNLTVNIFYKVRQTKKEKELFWCGMSKKENMLFLLITFT